MYNIFAKENENESDDNTVMTIRQTAALMAAPSSTSTTKSTAISAKVAAAINQLLANQTTMMAQMTAIMMAPPTALHTGRLCRGRHSMCHLSCKLRYPCTSRLQLKGFLAWDVEAAVWVAAKAGADVEVEAAHRLQMPCAAPEPVSHQ